MKITTTTEITPQQIADLIVTFIESGYSRYWCGGVLLLSHGGRHHKNRTDPGVHWYSDTMLYDPADTLGPLKIVVLEDEEETGRATKMKRHKIGLKEIEEGLQRAAEHKEYSHHFRDLVEENDDANTADVLLQLIVLKDVVYG